jgi:hypothetical protein
VVGTPILCRGLFYFGKSRRKKGIGTMGAQRGLCGECQYSMNTGRFGRKICHLNPEQNEVWEYGWCSYWKKYPKDSWLRRIIRIFRKKG